jgi:hypothetical protein
MVRHFDDTSRRLFYVRVVHNRCCMNDFAWAVRPTVTRGVVRVRQLFAVMIAVALLTLNGFSAGGIQHHGFGQIVANGESGGGD